MVQDDAYAYTYDISGVDTYSSRLTLTLQHWNMDARGIAITDIRTSNLAENWGLVTREHGMFTLLLADFSRAGIL
jgi:hypothetical protein